MDYLVIQILNGLSWSGLLFTMASGLSIVFGVMGVINFAHAALYMLGAYFFIMGSSFAGFWGGIPITLIILLMIGIAMELIFFRPVYGRAAEYQLLLTFGLVLLFEDLAKMTWGGTPIAGETPAILQGSIPILGKSFPIYSFFTLVVGAVVAFAVWRIVNRTKFGMLIRAASSDREMTGALGINPKLLFTAVFAFGALLAGLGGAISTPMYGAYPTLGSTMILQIFIVIVIGGMGSLRGVILGSLIIGVLQTVLVGYFPRFGIIGTFAIATAIMIIRPEGLLREA